MGFYQDSIDAGLVHFMAFPECMKGEGPIVETIQELIDDEFFQVVEVTHIADRQARREAGKRIADAGMRVGYGAQPIILGEQLNIHSRHRVTRARSMARLKQAIEEAAELGACGFAVMSGRDPGPEHRAEETDILVDSLGQLCTWSKEQKPDIRVILETFDRVEFGKNCLAGPTAEAVEFCKRVRESHAEFGIMLDLSHLPLLGEKASDSLPLAGDNLVHAHVGNCVCREASDEYYGDNHPPFGHDTGENDVAELADFLQQLRTIGYLQEGKKSIVTAEIRPMGGLTPADAIQNAKETMRGAWARLEA